MSSVAPAAYGSRAGALFDSTLCAVGASAMAVSALLLGLGVVRLRGDGGAGVCRSVLCNTAGWGAGDSAMVRMENAQVAGVASRLSCAPRARGAARSAAQCISSTTAVRATSRQDCRRRVGGVWGGFMGGRCQGGIGQRSLTWPAFWCAACGMLPVVRSVCLGVNRVLR